MPLLDHAKKVRENAYAPYSKFKVGAALITSKTSVFCGCNVENAAYPEGTCAEAGAIAAMIAAGECDIQQIAIVADCKEPLAPCGGCRQKILEFSTAQTRVVMATTSGAQKELSIHDLLPGAFDKATLDLKTS